MKKHNKKTNILFRCGVFSSLFLAVFALIQNGFFFADGVFFIFAGSAVVLYLLSHPSLPGTSLITIVRLAAVLPSFWSLAAGLYLLLVMIVNISTFGYTQTVPPYTDPPPEYNELILLTRNEDAQLFKKNLVSLNDPLFLRKTEKYRLRLIARLQVTQQMPQHFLFKLFGVVPDYTVITNTIDAECYAIELLLARGETQIAEKRTQAVFSAILVMFNAQTDVSGYTASLMAADAVADHLSRSVSFRSICRSQEIKPVFFAVISSMETSFDTSVDLEIGVMKDFIAEPVKGTYLFTGETPAARRMKILYNYGGRWPFTSLPVSQKIYDDHGRYLKSAAAVEYWNIDSVKPAEDRKTVWNTWFYNPFGNYLTSPLPVYSFVFERKALVTSKMQLLYSIMFEDGVMPSHDPLTGNKYIIVNEKGASYIMSGYKDRSGICPVKIKR